MNIKLGCRIEFKMAWTGLLKLESDGSSWTLVKGDGIRLGRGHRGCSAFCESMRA